MNEDADEFCMGYVSSSNYAGYISFFRVNADNTIYQITENVMGASYLTSYNSKNWQLCPMPNGDVCTQYMTDGYNACFFDVHNCFADVHFFLEQQIDIGKILVDHKFYSNYLFHLRDGRIEKLFENYFPLNLIS